MSMDMRDFAASTNGVTPSERKESPASPPFSVWSILRVVAVSLVVAHGIALCLWVGVSSLCDGIAEGDVCLRQGAAESGGGMRRVLCRSGGAAALKARTLLPLLPSPPDEEDRTASCPSAMGADDDAGDKKEEGRKKNPLSRFFDRRRTRKSEVVSSLSGHSYDDTEVLKGVVMKHRFHPGIVDERHPIKRVVDSAATLFRRRKARKAEAEERVELNPEAKERAKARRAKATEAWAIDAAFDGDLRLTASNKKLIATVAPKVRERAESDGNGAGRTFDDRVAAVGWGGPVSAGGRAWWRKKKGEGDGTQILSAYLKIMSWPSDLVAKFPFKLCANGCSADFALAHTLEWREKFRPWCITPSAVKENKHGFFFVRGYSPPPHGVDDKDVTGHTLVFYRPGLNQYDDTEAYLRIIIHSLDAAVADSLARSNDKVGKYNIVLDCNGFKFSMIPNLHDVKRLFAMMQDHFPDRLGILLITNLGGAAQLFLKMIKPIITEAVRNKIHVLPNSSEQATEMLTSLVDEAYIPTWLGGTDTFRFDAKAEYSSRLCTEEEGREYLTTMPYHA